MLKIWVKNPAVPVEIPPDIVTVNYGLYYNFYAVNDARFICATGWNIGTFDEFTTLNTYLSTNVGNKLKEIGETYWNTGNNGINTVGFNGRGSGQRLEDGTFDGLKVAALFYNSDDVLPNVSYHVLSYSSDALGTDGGSYSKLGISLRATRPATVDEQLLPDGLITATYTGNDGKVYRCTKIGTQVWTADNLCETKFRNGDYIHGYELGVYTPISNVDWAALTTDGVCCYNDDTDNI